MAPARQGRTGPGGFGPGGAQVHHFANRGGNAAFAPAAPATALRRRLQEVGLQNQHAMTSYADSWNTRGVAGVRNNVRHGDGPPGVWDLSGRGTDASSRVPVFQQPQQQQDFDFYRNLLQHDYQQYQGQLSQHQHLQHGGYAAQGFRPSMHQGHDCGVPVAMVPTPVRRQLEREPSEYRPQASAAAPAAILQLLAPTPDARGSTGTAGGRGAGAGASGARPPPEEAVAPASCRISDEDSLLQIQNTFLHSRPERSPSFDELFEERQVRSWPPSAPGSACGRKTAPSALVLGDADEPAWMIPTPTGSAISSMTPTGDGPARCLVGSAAHAALLGVPRGCPTTSAAMSRDSSQGQLDNPLGAPCAPLFGGCAASTDGGAGSSGSSTSGSTRAEPLSGRPMSTVSTEVAAPGTAPTPLAGALATYGGGAKVASAWHAARQHGSKPPGNFTTVAAEEAPRPATRRSGDAADRAPPPTFAPSSLAAQAAKVSKSAPVAAASAAGLPSAGSAYHNWGTCKPCAFVFKAGCANGINCQFCHLCEPGEKKRRKKDRAAARRSVREEGRRARYMGGGVAGGAGAYGARAPRQARA
eukprot:TRINITY_DN20498_c0_g1_i1.p1 TRINITY_DN20498_c0_g1~~TRINITY_DN20498_c0_g1_i1.p1  ORF type:complete len:586 (+),score=128.59 TRINITY_DN20498_c0_g1_i1:117-1874(+)